MRRLSRLSIAALLVGGVYWTVVLLSWAASESTTYFETVPPYLSVEWLVGVATLVGIPVLVLAVQGHLRSSIYSHVWVCTAVAAIMGLGCVLLWLVFALALVFLGMR